ncbi:MAG: amino acid racemase [Chloroflexota bacterium]|nr:amino acid racemase [Chloroflexota bacterium]
MKTIGVIGGMGPQATIDFEALVHTVSQRLIPQWRNTGYPPMLVYYHRYFPLMLDEQGRVVVPSQPEPHLLEKLVEFGKMVDFIVIPANAPHMFLGVIKATSGCRVLSMIDVTLEEVRRRGWRSVGVAGFGRPAVYLEPLEREGMSTETLPAETDGLRDRLDRAILDLMEGRSGAHGRKAAVDAVHWLRSRRVDGVILGCTEIPLLLGNNAHAPDLINPAYLLAEAAVKFSLD